MCRGTTGWHIVWLLASPDIAAKAGACKVLNDLGTSGHARGRHDDQLTGGDPAPLAREAAGSLNVA